MDRIRNYLRRAGAAVVLACFMVVAGASAALAQTGPVDPLDGAGDTFFTTLRNYATDTLIPAVVGLAIVGVAVSLLIKWGKRAAKSS